MSCSCNLLPLFKFLLRISGYHSINSFLRSRQSSIAHLFEFSPHFKQLHQGCRTVHILIRLIQRTDQFTFFLRPVHTIATYLLLQSRRSSTATTATRFSTSTFKGGEALAIGTSTRIKPTQFRRRFRPNNPPSEFIKLRRFGQRSSRSPVRSGRESLVRGEEGYGCIGILSRPRVRMWRGEGCECGDVWTRRRRRPTAFWSVCKSAIICANCRLSVADILRL